MWTEAQTEIFMLWLRTTIFFNVTMLMLLEQLSSVFLYTVLTRWSITTTNILYIRWLLWGCTTGPSGTWDVLYEAKPNANISHVPRGYSGITPLYHEEHLIIFFVRCHLLFKIFFFLKKEIANFFLEFFFWI